MWIYEYSKFDCSGFLPVGPFASREEAAREMTDYADRYGTVVRGPIQVNRFEFPPLHVFSALTYPTFSPRERSTNGS